MSDDEHIKLLQGHVARLQQKLTAMTAERDGLEKGTLALGSVIDGLRTKCAEFRKDAERYRWLRNDAADSELGVYMWVESNGKSQRAWLAMSELDKAIDAAMKGE